MASLFSHSPLADLIAKVEQGQRLNFDDGVRLMASKELLALGYMANLVRERKNGNKTYYIVNRHINHTNVCVNLCSFCAYGVKKEDPQAFTLQLGQIEEAARKAVKANVAEVHIVGGLNSELPFEYYIEMLRRVKEILPEACIQAFTAVEIDYFTQITGFTVEQVLTQLMEAGLDSLPGGGAEVFSPRVRSKICEKKVSGARWLEIQEAVHRLGMRTNGSMGVESTTGLDDLRMLAVSRIMLDNFDHIKTFWIMLGPKLAQVSLAFGVDDLDGTVVEERIIHSAGAETEQSMNRQELVKMIETAGREAVERDTLYRVRTSK